MKSRIKYLFLLPALIAALGLIPAGQVTAQIFTTLYSFDLNDGVGPQGGLVLSGSTLYGTTSQGGSSDFGTVFSVNRDGTDFTNLYSFTGNDGSVPTAGLILSGNILYGTTREGGNFGTGSIFAINTNSTAFTNLYSFSAVSADYYPTNSDGANPFAGLILLGNTLYGTAPNGGSSSSGIVFAINTNGTDFTNVYEFTATHFPIANPGTNIYGANPFGGLISFNNTLYGTAAFGGSSSGNGTVFAVNTDGTDFTNLHSFTDLSEGHVPVAGLVLSGDTLYGVVNQGGSSDGITRYGTIFAVITNGSGFRILHKFSGNEGANPASQLILSGNTLYGTASWGGNGFQGVGNSGCGTVFAINTDGTGFTNLHRFNTSDGANPSGVLILADNTLFGMTSGGGSENRGTIFSLSLSQPSTPQQLTINLSETNVVLTWPTNAVGFTLQSTTNLISPAIWNVVSPAPTVVNGQNTVTNSIFGKEKFYRLSQ